MAEPELVLHVDKGREGAVVPYLAAHVPAEMLHHQQMKRGDYAIVGGAGSKEPRNRGRIWAVIERKTHKDYADSIADGRTANKFKLLELREGLEPALWPHIYYIVEGPWAPSPDTEYGRIKWSSIEMSMVHLMTEYGIMVIRTRDANDTARYLGLLMKSYAVRPPALQGTAEPDLCSRFEVAIEAPVASRSADVALLYTAAKKAKVDLWVQLWGELPGFGQLAATRMAAASPLAILRGEAPIPVTAKQLETLRALQEPRWNRIQEDFLRAMPGIGPKRAVEATRYGACLQGLWNERAKAPAAIRNALEEVML